MADESRFYWIKLRTDFFNQKTIDFLLSQKNGCEYVVLYQMLCLQTANNDGELSTKIGEIIVPYNVEKIVRDTKYFDFDTVTIALGLFKQLGLVYESDKNGILKISGFSSMVGSSSGSKSAIAKRNYRNKKKEIMDKKVDKEIDIEVDKMSDRDKSIEIRDKSIEYRDKRVDNNINADSKSAFESEFESLWLIYPRKQGRSKALMAYIKARKEGETKEAILDGIKRYLVQIKTENTPTQYIKHGSTWFNQRCWHDDYRNELDDINENRPDSMKITKIEDNALGGKTKYYADGSIRVFDKYNQLNEELRGK